MPQQASPVDRDMRGDQTTNFWFRDFEGMNTQADRTSIGENEFSWLENVMPIGSGNMKVVPASGATIADLSPLVPYREWQANLGGIDYFFVACTDGSVQQILRVSPYTVTQIAVAATLTPTGCWMAQWKNERVLFVDTKGYFSWDGSVWVANGGAVTADFTPAGGTAAGSGYAVGNTLNLIGGAGTAATAKVTQINGSGGVVAMQVFNHGSGYTADYTSTTTGGGGSGAIVRVHILNGPTSANQIAVYAGRAWLGNKRIVSYSAPDSFYDFTVANAGGQFVITDPTLHASITFMLSGNDYLYIGGSNSVDVLSNVRVVSGATVFSRVNAEASIGTLTPESVFIFYRGVYWFCNAGIYVLLGSTPQKVSDKLDGIVPQIDKSAPITAGVVSIYNIICPAFCFTYNVPTGGARKLIAILNGNKWFLCDQGDVDVVVSVPAGTAQEPVYSLYGFVGSELRQLFSDTSSNVVHTWSTKLWDMGNPIITKQALKVGVAAVVGAGGDISVSVESEIRSNQIMFSLTNSITWIGSGGSELTFVGSGTIDWQGTGYAFGKASAEQNGNHLGMTVGSTLPGVRYSLAALQYKKLQEW